MWRRSCDELCLRSIDVVVEEVTVGAAHLPRADLVFIGGGQDREQVTVASELERLGRQLIDQVADGTALLAVCGGYQNLGTAYRTALGDDLPCPGLLPVSTDATGRRRRLVGPVVAQMGAAAFDIVGSAMGAPDDRPESSADASADLDARRLREPRGPDDARDRCHAARRRRDRLRQQRLDRTEGVLVRPGEGGLLGLRVGTYLHGPLLPRNPHLADALIAAALARGRIAAEARTARRRPRMGGAPDRS